MAMPQLLRRGLATLAGRDAVIVSAVRTPVGAFRGALAAVPATQLGALAIKGALGKGNVKPGDVDEVIMGNVVSANLGQAPARQAQLAAGIPTVSEALTINKVCASGMKAITLAAQNVALGLSDVIVAGGMESMSSVPYYLDKGRAGLGYGHGSVLDGIIKDGLWDVYNNIHMGSCTDACAKKHDIGREAQDAFAVESYKRANAAQARGQFNGEIVPVPVSKDAMVTEDEEPKKVKYDKIPVLKPAFGKDGTVTAANASKLNDGASAVVVMSAERAAQLGLKPLARIVSYSDGAHDPIDFPSAPAKAVERALKRAKLSKDDIALHEINEAFAAVVLINAKLLGLDLAKVNVAGGAVSLGHPIGSSGCRIVVTLTHLLKPGQLGCASICNGGGGSTAVIIERL